MASTIGAASAFTTSLRPLRFPSDDAHARHERRLTMAAYRFVTNWRLDAPIDAVWNEIYASERWPEWWSSVLSVVVVRDGDERGVGAIRRYTWRGALPYKLTFEMTTTAVEKPVRLDGL